MSDPAPMARDPFFIDGPALISFSGGRTSGYMLWRILQAHGGKLPDGVVVGFADTGKEHPETYVFVHAVSTRWKVPVSWVEMAHEGHATPFDALIARKKYLPNPIARFCTEELKMKPLFGLMSGIADWDNVVGIRADEPLRVARIRGRTSGPDTVLPLVAAGVTRGEVMDFWSEQDFDLRIPPGHGNCVGCFLKGAKTLVAIEQHTRGSLAWWAAQEAKVAGTFRNDRPNYASIIEFATRQITLRLDNSDARPDCFCAEDSDT